MPCEGGKLIRRLYQKARAVPLPVWTRGGFALVLGGLLCGITREVHRQFESDAGMSWSAWIAAFLILVAARIVIRLASRAVVAGVHRTR